jgi:tryptophan-rich sensory protein
MLSNDEERALYDQQLQQAPWAPPGWLFGPAWAFNNFFLLQALQRILQKNDFPQRNKMLIYQVFIWIIFFSFGYVYFNKRSSLLAAIWTVSDTVLAALSFAASIKRDKTLALNYLPLLIWTGFASTVAVYQALMNPDPLFNANALID